MKHTGYLLFLFACASTNFGSKIKTPTNNLKFSGSGKSLWHSLANTRYYPLIQFEVEDRKIFARDGIISTNTDFLGFWSYTHQNWVAIARQLNSEKHLFEIWNFTGDDIEVIYDTMIKGPLTSLAISSDDMLTSFSRENALITYNYKENQETGFYHSSTIKTTAFSPDSKYHVITPKESSEIYWYDLSGIVRAIFLLENGIGQETIFNPNGDIMCVPSISKDKKNKTLVKLFDIQSRQEKDCFDVKGLPNSGKHTGQHLNSYYLDENTVMVNTQDQESKTLFSYLIDTRSGDKRTIAHAKNTASIFTPVDQYLPVTYEPGTVIAASVINLKNSGRKINILDEDKNACTHIALNPEDKDHAVTAQKDIVNTYSLKWNKKLEN